MPKAFVSARDNSIYYMCPFPNCHHSLIPQTLSLFANHVLKCHIFPLDYIINVSLENLTKVNEIRLKLQQRLNNLLIIDKTNG